MEAPPHLLLVDDDPSLRAMLGWAFEDLGYRVSAVGSIGAALGRARRGRIDYAILDYGLPDGTGEALLRALHRLQPEIQAVILSAEGSEERRRAARRAGALEFLLKPVPLTACPVAPTSSRRQGSATPAG